MPDVAAGEARALWYVGGGRAELRREALGPPAPGEALVRMIASGVSRGTERLVASGKVPESEFATMRAPFQAGDFPFPVKYGYQAVGIVEDGPEALAGRTVFSLYPHQDRFILPVAALVPLPDGLPPRRATLAANMETALNALWDAAAGPGDRIVIIGGGVVGLMLTALCCGLPGAEVTLVDIDSGRAVVARSFGAAFALPEATPQDADVVFHASASAAGLATAVAAAGIEARIVELSWYGAGTIAAPLGGRFHSRRLSLIGSQVGRVSPSRRPRWDHARRLAKALDLVNDARFDALVTHTIAFAEAPDRLPQLLTASDALGIVIAYP
ncbi:MAG: dehydrogenase [Ancalomicrobiaceae bacterium]|nr:dehydrogenase [Ancalomicrobiaceae bacterium]